MNQWVLIEMTSSMAAEGEPGYYCVSSQDCPICIPAAKYGLSIALAFNENFCTAQLNGWLESEGLHRLYAQF